MLSIFTNPAAMSSNNSLNRATGELNTSMERLGTGKRINAAKDDAAGLQIATRLQGQSNGISVAKSNINKASALLQTAEGAFDEVSQILFRMKDLATQAADDTNSAEDRKSLQSEFSALNSELNNIMSNTSYGREKLLKSVSDNSVTGKLTQEMQFQIGASKDEALKINMGETLNSVTTSLADLTASDIQTSAAAGNAMLEKINLALDDVGTMRSELGAGVNRLGHTAKNLANMKDNSDQSIGIIRDADFAAEASEMNRQNMLAQSSQMMLKQSNQMSGLVMGMLS
ncbi:flagellin N-terminal helical domain-containing protein [Pantoea sp. A4]|uniref:flagellin N-terminal helical domain-containing protein n=1 Tax=Pantoea sp. A4 TaxID=1225184 RepID=UPI0008FADA6B|nr:flagellin [Pantoea sp. A4]